MVVKGSSDNVHLAISGASFGGTMLRKLVLLVVYVSLTSLSLQTISAQSANTASYKPIKIASCKVGQSCWTSRFTEVSASSYCSSRVGCFTAGGKVASEKWPVRQSDDCAVSVSVSREYGGDRACLAIRTKPGPAGWDGTYYLVLQDSGLELTSLVRFPCVSTNLLSHSCSSRSAYG